jgi:hypothetical protein
VPVQRPPERRHPRVAAVLGAGAEARVVPERQHAPLGGGTQIAAQPLVLHRARRVVDVAVQRDQVPARQVEAVVAGALRPRPGAEVGEVAGGPRRVVVVVARRRHGPALEPAPRRVVVGAVLGERAVVVLLVAEHEDAGGVHLEHQVGGPLLATEPVRRDVADSSKRGCPHPLDRRDVGSRRGAGGRRCGARLLGAGGDEHERQGEGSAPGGVAVRHAGSDRWSRVRRRGGRAAALTWSLSRSWMRGRPCWPTRRR